MSDLVVAAVVGAVAGSIAGAVAGPLVTLVGGALARRWRKWRRGGVYVGRIG